MTVVQTGRHHILVVITLAVVVLAGCAREATVMDPPQDRISADAVYFLEHLSARQETVDADYYDKILAERLPNVLFSVDRGEAQSLGDGIVVGEVTGVEAGRGYVAEEDAVGGQEVGFDSPEALWRTLSITVETTKTWGFDGNQASFGLAFDGQADRLRMLRGALDLGRVIVALGPKGFFGHDESLYQVARNGSLIGMVDSSGAFTFPALGESESTYVAGMRTLASISEAVQRPTTIRIVGGVRRR